MISKQVLKQSLRPSIETGQGLFETHSDAYGPLYIQNKQTNKNIINLNGNTKINQQFNFSKNKKNLIVTIIDYNKLNDQIFWQDQSKC